MVSILSKEKFVRSIFDDFKIYLEASSINAKTFLVTNDKKFYMSMLLSKFFFKVIYQYVKNNILLVRPATLKLATDVVSDMP